MKTVLITGCSSGFGLETARWFLARDWQVVATMRTPRSDVLPPAERLRVLALDVTDPGSIRAAVEAAGPVDVLVNNAGFGFHGMFWQIPLERQLQMIQLNMTTLTELTYRLLPGMIERKRGRILNVASTAAFQPGPLMAVYYATKAYVLSLSEALSNELKGTGVSVTALCPGPTATEFQKTADLKNIPLLKSGMMMSAGSVAEKGYRALMREKRIAIPGFMNKMTAFSTRLAPRGLITSVVRSLQSKR
jgi:uncharacterized protein